MSKVPRRILVSDSDHAFARALRLALEARGYVVEMVGDGLSAINMVKMRPFSGAVVDTDVVTVDGLHVLALIKDLRRALPVVVTSRRDRPETERQAREAGAEAYLCKPCEPERVADALHRCVRGGAPGVPRRRPALTLARLEPGQMLVIECPGRQIKGRLSSRLIAQQPASLAITAPRREDEVVSLSFGVPLRAGFPMRDGWYYFDSYVLGAVTRGGEPAILLAQPKVVSHIQRRRHVRAQGAFAVVLETTRGSVAGRGEDACEGGMRVVTQRPMPVGSLLPCRIEMGEAGEHLGLSGRVVWTQELRGNGRRYQLGIAFSPTSGMQRKRLLAWVEEVKGAGDDCNTPPV